MPPALSPWDACLRAIEVASERVLSAHDPRIRNAPEAVFRGLHAALIRTAIADDSLTADQLSELHQTLLSTRAELTAGSLRLVLRPSARGRQASGAFYTPASLVNLLLDASLSPLLARCLCASDPSSAIGALRVLDPSCGTGFFLRAAADRIALALLASRGRDPSPEALRDAREEVSARCLFGIDSDPLAVEIARVTLGASGHFAVAEALSLRDYLPESSGFSEVYARGGFDLVVGNPPFLNAIDGRASGSVASHPSLRGTADTAFHFLALADTSRAADGYVAMIQPRALLSASSARALRASLATRGVSLLFAPERSDFFAGAKVMIAAVVLGPTGQCRVSFDDDPRTAVFRSVPICDGDWWRALHPPRPSNVGHAHTPLGERFEVHASMATGEAYALRGALIDALDGEGPKLVTTGLIDPGACLWGARTCLYLRQKYRHPRVALSLAVSPSLTRRAALWSRPKILVAGLSRRLECFFDAKGDCAGAVSTWTITHPTDDRDALRALCDALNAAEVSQEFVATLGASRMGEGGITVTRGFLEALRV